MKIIKISLSKLSVNQANDRHGELVSEEDAILWLLTHHRKEMRKLATDISKVGEIFEPPLILMEGEKFTVYDGNRRTTCLKLIRDPSRAPSKDWRIFFQLQKKNFNGKVPAKITCQLEDDRDRVDEILYRRHTGKKDGVGQAQWDNPAKTNFERRTGKKTKVDVAEEIEHILHNSELLPKSLNLPRSTVNRLLSSERFRNRVGLTLSENLLAMTHNKTAVTRALSKVATDMMGKEITLNDVWNNSLKTSYLNRLDLEGYLPSANDLLDTEVSEDSKKSDADLADETTKAQSEEDTGPPEEKGSDSSTQEEEEKPIPRTGLMRPMAYPFNQNHHNRRALDIFRELENNLVFGSHDNAISVLFRVLLELSIDSYVSSNNLQTVRPNDKLAKKFEKVAASLLDSGMIRLDYKSRIVNFGNREHLVSAQTMHGYVHSPDFFPSQRNLQTMWDTMEKFIIACLRD